MRLRASLGAILLLFSLAPAAADGEVDRLITPADRMRLKTYAETRQAAVAEARKGGTADELATFEAILARPLKSFSVYDWFKCRVGDDGSGWRLEKISGSQRTTGRFFDDGDKRLIYLGSQYVVGEPARPYGSGPESDQVGYAFRTGAKEWRIEFPAPYYESKLDILEFRR